ncbi:MAG: hypothetical protein QMD46_04045 [Methanomicrobiales archaeon]|nr:hypothetical protein [Methanomicrobiales archaeon]MDI6876847.1 hypothetical protein [Methanomicrobiales archaeon]
MPAPEEGPEAGREWRRAAASAVYHATVMEGLRDEAERRVRRALKRGRSSDPGECRRAVSELEQIFLWYSGHIERHREGILQAIPESEEKRRAETRGRDHIRSLQGIHWSPGGTVPDRAGFQPGGRRGEKE